MRSYIIGPATYPTLLRSPEAMYTSMVASPLHCFCIFSGSLTLGPPANCTRLGSDTLNRSAATAVVSEYFEVSRAGAPSGVLEAAIAAKADGKCRAAATDTASSRAHIVSQLYPDVKIAVVVGKRSRNCHGSESGVELAHVLRSFF